MFILYEIIDIWESPEKKVILEIDDDKDKLEKLAEQYTAEYNDFVSKIQNGRRIISDIRLKVNVECPIMLLEQESIVGTLTKEQQTKRSKIGMINAEAISRNLEQKDKVYHREMNLLSKYDKTCVEISKQEFEPCRYVVEEMISVKPSFGVNTF